MIEITGAVKHGKIISMDKMEPLQIGTICETASSNKDYVGHVVLRTASTFYFEVMDLTNPGDDCCWTDRPTLTHIKVFIPKETLFTVEISNRN